MGGFVVQRGRDPPYSVCGCSNTQTVCRSFFNSLHECGGDSSRPVYVVPSLIQTGVCPALKSSDRLNSWNGGNRSGVGDSGDVWSGDGVMEGGCEAVEFPHHYEVDGLSADLLQRAGACGCGNVTGGGCECGDCEGGRMVSAHYYQDSEETLSVTVWYNNRVSETHVLQCVKPLSMGHLGDIESVSYSEVSFIRRWYNTLRTKCPDREVSLFG